MSKLFAICVTFIFCVGYVAGEYCYNDVVRACSPAGAGEGQEQNCNSSFDQNRGGFEKLYRQLSDNTWEQAIDLVKFIGKRGGDMNLNERDEEHKENIVYDMYEMSSMAKALDIQKGLAEKAFSIHKNVTRNNDHDPEVASYLENNFLHQHSEIIRKLSGYLNDLKTFNPNNDQSLSLYLFDEYLQKTL